MSPKSPDDPKEVEAMRFVKALYEAVVEESLHPKPAIAYVKPHEAGRILHDYGLDEAPTAQDDPVLWAMALTKHWPTGQAGLQWARVPFCYCFSVGKQTDDRWHLQPIESWELELVGTGGFRATKREPMMQLKQPWRVLRISRPSKDAPEATVVSGQMLGPLCGNGATHIWLRQPDGTWTESQPPTHDWVS